MRKLSRIIIIVILAVVVNLALFSVAVQMGDLDSNPDRGQIAAIKLTTIEPPKPVEPPKPKEEQEPPKTVERTQPRTVANRPQVNVNLPKLNIDVNPRLTTGFALDPSLIGEEIQAPPTTSFSGVFGLDEVDVAPSILRSVQPEYPYSAKRKGETGVVEVKALVGADGNVQSVSVVSATPKGVFEDAVLVAVRKWKFKPGVKDGQNVPTWVVFPVRFELNK